MTCKEYEECSLRKHLEKILGLDEATEDSKIKLKEILDKTCNDKGINNDKQCSLQAVACCSRFPDCSTVLSRRRLFKDDLIRLALFTCTSLGIGRCTEMAVSDAKLAMSGKEHLMTLANNISKKFKGI